MWRESQVAHIFRIGRLNLTRDDLYLGLQLRQCGLRLQAADHPEPILPAALEPVADTNLAAHCHGHPKLVREETLGFSGVRRRHSDNLKRMPIDFDWTPEHVRIRIKACLPKLVADDDHGSLAGCRVLLRQKRPAQLT